MANGNQLSPEEQKALEYILGIIGLILTILVLIIMVARVIFWVSVVLFFVAILYFVIGLVIDIIRLKEDEEFDVFGAPHFLVALGLIGVFWILAHFAFPVGYSEFSYQVLEWNEDYTDFVGLPAQVTIEALNETCSSIPESSYCETIIGNYKYVEKVQEVSDTAKLIQGLFNLRLK